MSTVPSPAIRVTGAARQQPKARGRQVMLAQAALMLLGQLLAVAVLTLAGLPPAVVLLGQVAAVGPAFAASIVVYACKPRPR